MGRLLRKKDPVKKIKKTQSGGETGSEPNAPVAKESPSPAEKKSYTPVAKPVVAKEKNLFDKGLQFLREVRMELKKVTWPSRKQTIGSTVVVLAVVAIVSLFLGIIDAGLSGLIRAVLR
jgi:preprotein translocase subunit SecE